MSFFNPQTSRKNGLMRATKLKKINLETFALKSKMAVTYVWNSYKHAAFFSSSSMMIVIDIVENSIC